MGGCFGFDRCDRDRFRGFGCGWGGWGGCDEGCGRRRGCFERFRFRRGCDRDCD